MHVSERGSKRPRAGLAWTLLAVLLLFGLVIVLFTGGSAGIVFAVFFSLGLLACAVKAYAAFTGVRRFGPS